MDELTPWELHKGVWYKRDDYYRHPLGPNGSKYRLARHLISRAAERGARTVVSASSVHSPQAAIAGAVAHDLGMRCIIVLGASKPTTAVRHESVRIAVEAGAELDTTPRVAYNTVIQPYAARLAERLGDAYQLPYAITPPTEPKQELIAALEVGGAQVENLPAAVRTLILPFGSGNTAAGVLYGLATGRAPTSQLETIVLVGVGPDKLAGTWRTLEKAGVRPADLPPVAHTSLHGWFASYADLMPEEIDGVKFHPTYEGKVVRYLNYAQPDWWAAANGRAAFWIVGGPLS